MRACIENPWFVHGAAALMTQGLCARGGGTAGRVMVLAQKGTGRWACGGGASRGGWVEVRAG